MREKESNQKFSLKSWYVKNLKALLWNLRYRIIFLFLDVLVILALIYIFLYVINQTPDWVGKIGLFAYLLIFLYPFMSYGYRSFMQIAFELGLINSIYNVRKEIKKVKERNEEQDFYTLQVAMNKLRIDLKNFIDFSEILSPPIYNYELNRLHKSIDIFFNSVSEALFPIPHAFSKEHQLTLDYYQILGDTIEEEEIYRLAQRRNKINNFDLYALDEFLDYLGKVLFETKKAYSPFSQKHPINLIALSKFFDYWNSVVSSCRNCKSAYTKAKNDIEQYYRSMGEREMQHKQRIRRLIDDILIIIISVIASTIINSVVNYLIR